MRAARGLLNEEPASAAADARKPNPPRVTEVGRKASMEGGLHRNRRGHEGEVRKLNARSSAGTAVGHVGGGCDGRFRARQPADEIVTETGVVQLTSLVLPLAGGQAGGADGGS